MAGIFGGIARRGMTIMSRSSDLSGVSSPSQWLRGLFGGGATSAGMAVGPESSTRSTAVYACVQILSEDPAKLPIIVYEGERRGRNRKEARDHPLSRLLRGSITGNDGVFRNWLTAFEFWRFHQRNYLLGGNGYILKRQNGRGDIIGLVPLPYRRVQILEAADGELFYQVSRGTNHDAALTEGYGFTIPGEYIIHDRGPTRDGVYGISPITEAREAIGLALAGEWHASRTFNSGARPSGVLQHPKTISKEAGDRLKAQFNDNYGGIDNVAKTLLLEEGLTFEPITMTNADSQFIESRRFQNKEIARIFRVPPYMIADLEGTTNSNVDAQDRQYVGATLMAHLRRIEDFLELHCLSETERERYFIEFDESELLRGDLKSRYEAYALGRQWGWLSVNDVRREERMAAVPDGDEYLQPLNMVPLGTAPAAPGDAKPGAPSTTAPGTTPPGIGENNHA